MIITSASIGQWTETLQKTQAVSVAAVEPQDTSSLGLRLGSISTGESMDTIGGQHYLFH